jgi:hypothetical protein
MARVFTWPDSNCLFNVDLTFLKGVRIKIRIYRSTLFLGELISVHRALPPVEILTGLWEATDVFYRY